MVSTGFLSLVVMVVFWVCSRSTWVLCWPISMVMLPTRVRFISALLIQPAAGSKTIVPVASLPLRSACLMRKGRPAVSVPFRMALARMLEKMLTDAELRERLIAEAREHVLQFDWAEVARETAAVHQELVAAMQAAT